MSVKLVTSINWSTACPAFYLVLWFPSQSGAVFSRPTSITIVVNVIQVAKNHSYISRSPTRLAKSPRRNVRVYQQCFLKYSSFMESGHLDSTIHLVSTRRSSTLVENWSEASTRHLKAPLFENAHNFTCYSLLLARPITGLCNSLHNSVVNKNDYFSEQLLNFLCLSSSLSDINCFVFVDPPQMSFHHTISAVLITYGDLLLANILLSYVLCVLKARMTCFLKLDRLLNWHNNFCIRWNR